MKKLLTISFLLAMSSSAFAELKFVRCVSGDCRNGSGQAVYVDPAWSTPGEYTYTGTFKDGQMDGEGTLVSNVSYFSGSFENGKQVGYGIAFTSKKVSGANVPDSSKWVDVGRWDDDGSMHSVQIHEDGQTGYYNTESAGKHSKNFHPYAEVKDKWIKAHVADYLAAAAPVFAERKRQHDSMFPPPPPPVDHHMTVHAQARINTARGKLERLITWDCTSARRYYVTASNVERGRLTAMPFGGFVRYQVRTDDDKVLWEGAADQYWHPAKDGKYSFLIIFDANVIGGKSPDGAYIEWSLRSETP